MAEVHNPAATMEHGHGHTHDHTHGHGEPAGGWGLRAELVEHLPFSVSAATLGLIVAGIICFITPESAAPAAETAAEHALHSDEAHDHDHAANPFIPLFHLFHAAHMFFSAAATTAMFWRYERRWLKAVLIGLVGAVGVCGLSDIVMPQLALVLLGKPVPWHVCILEHPMLVLAFAAIGVLVGLVADAAVHRSTFFSHSLHVFASTMASIFYMIGPFGRLGWIDSLGVFFIFIVVTVMLPCCLSDIVYPVMLAKGAHQRYKAEPHVCV